MPELPEVETTVKSLNILKYKKVINVDIHVKKLRYLVPHLNLKKIINHKIINLRRIANLAHNLGGIDSYDNLCELAQNDFIEMGPFQASWNALLQDLNASASLGELFGAIKFVEGKLAGQDISEEDRKIYKQGLSTIVNAFGWDLPDADSENKDVEVPEEVQLLANQRWEAKSNKEWAESDRLRDEINSLGWIIKDDKEGYQLEPETN